MSVVNLKVRHNAQVKTIALYNGLASEELGSILQAVFLLSATAVVVGFLSPEVSAQSKAREGESMITYCFWMVKINRVRKIVFSSSRGTK